MIVSSSQTYWRSYRHDYFEQHAYLCFPEEAQHSIDTPDLIDRLAAEMRATGDRELPHSFYVEQVKRTLAGKTVKRADNDEMPRTKFRQPAHPLFSSAGRCPNRGLNKVEGRRSGT